MPCGNSTAVCGWGELMQGNILGSAYVLMDSYLLGWLVIILFLIFQFMLIIKTKNITLSWITGVIFAALYGTSVFVKTISIQVLVILLILELGVILYTIFFK